MIRSVYIAAPYPIRDLAQGVMRFLEEAGLDVTSSWLKSEDHLDDKHARLDLADVDRADALVLLNHKEWVNSGTGGRHVEVGYAIARGKPIVLVGERSNIFHYLNDVIVVPAEVAAGSLAAVLKGLRRDPARLPIIVALQDVTAELMRAEAKHKPFNSHHEGFAVIQEEVDELWDDVKADRKEAALKEAVQVAAMGLRFVVNLTPARVPDRELAHYSV